MENLMTQLARRSVLLFALAAVPAAYASRALAVDALPDARFVGYAQAHNDFEIASAKLALSKSNNENVRGFANRALIDYDLAAQRLVKSRSEAGVSYAPDPNEPTAAVLRRLSSLDGPQFDAAYANAQLAAATNAEAQYGAFSQAGQGGPLRRYAQEQYPKIRAHLELAQRLAGSF
jgi:putative membrane protein